MSISLQSINLGDYANDGTGDDLRTAFAKVNINFNALSNDLTSLVQDTSPKLGGDLDLNGFNLKSSTPIRIQAGQVVVSGTVTASQFIGQISDISNHKLDDLSDVIVPNSVDLIQGQALIYNGRGNWIPGTPDTSRDIFIDGGASASVFSDPDQNIDGNPIIDGGNA
jgi:hypothetical protein